MSWVCGTGPAAAATESAAESGFEATAAGTANGASAGGDVLDDIVVTAQKRSETTQKIGLSISAFSEKQLETLGVNDVKDVASLVPGFTVATSYRGPPIYTLRGVGFNTPNMSTASPVGIYMDEVAFPYPIMTDGLSFDLERVEVLKGPQGTLYGRNTTGGLVNSIARQPSQESDVELKATYGSYGRYAVEGVVGGGLTDTLSSRLAFSVDRTDQGWQENIISGERLGKVDKGAARLALKWQPAAGAQFLLTGNMWQDKSDTQAGQSIFVYAKGLASAGVPQSAWTAVGPLLGVPLALFSQAFSPTSATQANWVTQQPVWGGTVGGHNFLPSPAGQLQKDNDMRSIALRGDIDLPHGLKLTSLTSYADFTRNETVDAGGMALEDGISNEVGYIKSFSQELRLAGTLPTLDWIAGLFYAHDRIHEVDHNWGAVTTDIDPLRVIGSNFLPPGSTLAQKQDVLYGFRDWENDDDQTVNTRAIFGQSQWHFAPDWSLTTGARYTRDDTSFSGCSRDRGDDSIAATWNGFFANYLGVPSSVAPGGCVTYLGNLTSYVKPNPAFVPLANPTEFLVVPGLGAFPGQGVVHQTLGEDNVSGRVGLDWQASDNLLLYGNVARGFKAGAFPNVSANVSTQYDPAKQEQLIAYEAGVKSHPIGSILLNGAIFYDDYKNKQVYGYVPDIVYGTLNRIVNIPKSHLYGAETEFTAPLVAGLTFHATATYLQTKIDEYNGYDDFGVPHNFKGASYTFTPKIQANAMLTYGFAPTADWDVQGTLLGRYSGRQQADLLGDPRFAIIDYTLLDANIVLTKSRRYETELFVKNLTDKYYWNSVQYYEDSVVRYAGMPRTWGVSFKATF